MKQLKIIQPIILLSFPVAVVAQDTIFSTKQRQFLVKVIEVEDLKVKYRKFDNLEGPIYSVDKSEIFTIHYKNGARDTFAVIPVEPNESSISKDDFLKSIKTPNLNVFVTTTDAASLIHAKNALLHATNWNLVDDKSKSKIVVRFTFVSIGMGDKKGKAQFLDPKTEEVIFETNTVNTAFSWDVNTKRGVIDKIVNKEIKKLLKE